MLVAKHVRSKAVGALIAALGISWMAVALARDAGRRFEARDARDAEAMVRAFATPRGGLLDGVASDAGNREISVRARSVSLAFREARVEVAAAGGAEYVFAVDLGDRSIHPGNPAAERVLNALLVSTRH